MKKILTKIILGTCLIASTSCSDQFLEDKRDYNNMIPIDIYKDPTQAKAVYGTIYKQIMTKYSHPLCGADPLMRQDESNGGGRQYVLTEEVPSGRVNSGIVGDGRYNGDNAKNTKAGNHIAGHHYWNGPRGSANYNDYTKLTLYPTVYLINEYINEIERGRSMINDEAFWDGLKGQAIFTRAWLYFDAVRLWGGLPYYNTEEDQAMPGDRSERLTVEECIEKICTDFKAAAALLPQKWDSENEGRFTSVAALAMISRARLYAASPVFNASWDNPASKRWQAALEAGLEAEQAANAAGHGTSVNSIDDWDRMFYSYGGTAFNPEAIIKIQKSDNPNATGISFNKWESHVRPGSISTSGSGAGLPAPEQMISLFPMADGSRPTAENGYDDDKFYRNRDPRFYRTFAISGCEWPGTNKQVWLYAYKYDGSTYRYTDGNTGDASAQGKSRALVWKMSDPTAESETTASTDILEYRYAEILLNIAECYAAKGDAGNCLNYLMKIRQRVGINSANNYGLGSISDRYALIEAVLYERFVELAYEGKRSWDMRRWLLYEGGAGFDPRLANIQTDNIYDPELAYGAGWKLYNGQNGKPEYTKTNNVLTKLGLNRFSGTKHRNKVWGYDLDNAHKMEGMEHPLKENASLKAVPAIKRDMSPADRNAAFDKLEAFYADNGMITVDFAGAAPKMPVKYAMDSGNNNKQQNFLFAFRGWYYVYPAHYDLYTPGKGNDWIKQTEGWMIENANPTGNGPQEQNGTYVYCAPEQ